MSPPLKEITVSGREGKGEEWMQVSGGQNDSLEGSAKIWL